MKKILLALIVSLAVSVWAEDVAVPIAAPVAMDPTVVQGTPPVFPIKTFSLTSIDDSKQNVADNFNRKHEVMELDLKPMEDILVALTASSQEHLTANINPAITFKMLMSDMESSKHRGEVVRLNGVLKLTGDNKEAESCTTSPNASGISKMWIGQTTSIDGKLITFRSIEPLPENVKDGDSVKLVGIFMQRYSFLNKQPGDMLTWTPLIFVRRVEPYTSTQVASANNSMNNAAAIVVFSVVSLGLAFYMYSRLKSKVSKTNPFTHIKAAKAGPPSYFPRNAPPKKKKILSKNDTKKDKDDTSHEESIPKPES